MFPLVKITQLCAGNVSMSALIEGVGATGKTVMTPMAVTEAPSDSRRSANSPACSGDLSMSTRKPAKALETRP